MDATEAWNWILRYPRSDDARRAWADCMEAQDPALARMVRLQLEIAAGRRLGRTEEPGFAAKITEKQSLEYQHGSRWAKALEGLVPQDRQGRYRCTFRRGCVEGVPVQARDFLDRADAFYRAAPILDLSVKGLDCPEEFFDSPFLCRIRSLNLIGNQLGDAAILSLCHSPFVDRVAWLDLSCNGLSRKSLEALAASPNLPALRFLRFEENEVESPVPYRDQEDGRFYEARIPAIRAGLLEGYGEKPWLQLQLSVDLPDPEAFSEPT